MNANDKNFIAQKIRSQYMEQQPSELDELRALDAKVKRPATVFAYTFGSVSALVMGAGMSLVMTEIGAVLGLTGTMVSGVIIGAAGLVMAIANYPIYKKLLESRKAKYADQILALSEKIINR